jgi:dTDP-4-amino-4,6-dideoxygalactose transaminase
VAPVRFQRPELPAAADVESYLAASRAARWFSNGGPCHERLTSGLVGYLGGDLSIVLTANATLGLMIALRSLLSPDRGGSLVLTPSFTFPATAQAICWAGLRPLWVDVERDGWHVDPAAVDRALALHGEEIAAVLACSTFGTAPAREQSAAWEQSCSSAGVPLLVDSAAGFGSRDEHGRALGGQGDAEVFSFHATKPFAIGEGGAVVMRDRELAQRIAELTNFGFNSEREVGSPFGLNAKMSEAHAAIGLAVLDRFDDILAARRTRAEQLKARLEHAGYRFQRGALGSTWQFVPVLAPSAAVRDAVIARAAQAQIEIRTYHEPLHRLAAFGEFAPAEELPVTESLAPLSLSLPLANDLSVGDCDRVGELLLECADSSPATAMERR